ncbi:Pentatricopeptide repeat-containing protein [Forsythia ovata]|uniref:Pentatricopeptide repeat-containing protein n=1 Tax=Forsythia ovata TaxID=205694 RepID=A0ABD1T3N0_9LAMI
MEAPICLNLKNLPYSRKKRATHDWDSIVKHHAKLKNDNAILTTYTHMESLHILPNTVTLPLILKACGNLHSIELGKKIHNDVMNTGLINDVRVGTSLVDFYCKCGRLEEARYVFDAMRERDVVAWNAMISGCVECKEFEEAVFLVMEMQRDGLRPNARTMVSLLMATAELVDLGLGKEIHGYCLRNGFLELNAHVGTSLIEFYLKFDVRMAYDVFESMNLRNIVRWNAMINGYFDKGYYFEALDLFVKMLMNGLRCDLVTILIAIQACAEYGCLKLGMQVHQLAMKCDFNRDLYIVNALMNMYSQFGCIEFAHALFRSISTRDVALWNSMLSAYIESGATDEAVALLRTMRLEGIRPDERTIVIILPVRVDLANGLRNGRSLHAYVVKCGMQNNVCIRNAFLNLFGELNCVEDASKIFAETKIPDVLSWNMMILALARNELRGRAWDLFMKMSELHVIPNSHTIVSILAACNDKSFLELGRSIHGYVIKHGIEIDPPLHTALTEMYMNCSDEATAEVLFESFSNRDLISWNAMIASYVKNNEAEKALFLFHRLILNIEPNAVTIINALSSCTSLANLPEGQCLHAYATRKSLVSDLAAANTFISMYTRCGCMNYAETIFKALPKRNVVSWNAMIACYGIHGRGYDAMLAFSKMLDEGFIPDKITFISALSSCSHSGFIEKGLQLYQSMIRDFKITPEPVHYACVVDLLARGGRFEQAWDFINSMPIAPIPSAWRSLLGACRVYSETKHAHTIFEKLIELEPTNAGNYVLLSNIYAAACQWSEVEKLRKLLREKDFRKPPGKSWVSVRNKIHYFTAGDKLHPQCDKIYRKLESLLSSIKERGYVPDLRWVLHDEEDEEKFERLLSHSEKLAIAFGLISIRGGAPILITKNLRICGDCHEFSKHVSKLVGREIILRDGNRFHHFIDGVCSCKDFW